MLLYGIDIGGTLAKLVCFESTDENTIENDKTYKSENENVTNKILNGLTVIEEVKLELAGQKIGKHSGRLRFVQFPTQEIGHFINNTSEANLSRITDCLYATGGGSFKFEDDFKKKANLTLKKIDEFDSLMIGAEYVVLSYNNECYSWSCPDQPGSAERVHVDFRDPYPYLVVNIGTATSITLVDNERNHKLIGGTTFGGGTFLGLCHLLTRCKTFKDAIALASKGDNTKVDKRMIDVYGGDYEKLGVASDLVISSFGNMTIEEDHLNAREEDLAKSTLLMTIGAICRVVRSAAVDQHIERIVFVGNFLKDNALSMQLIASKIASSSKGSLKVIFLEHGGYLCALGSLQSHFP